MPDLNLIEEGGFDDTPTPAATPAKKKIPSSGGGNSGGKALLILLVLLILCGGVYFLNQRGIIKLWGEKKQPISQMQEDDFSVATGTEEQTTQTRNPDDTTVTLLETSPVADENLAGSAEQGKNADQSAAKSTSANENNEIAETGTSSKLSEMKGEYTIQVIAYREKEEAVETSENLEIAGYASFVEKVPMKGGEWYTVRIGRYASPEEAKKAVQTFPEQLQAHYVIDKIRTK